jgi:hypothetical protein
LALIVCNTGNKGHAGIGHVNLDYFDYGDCDVYPPGGDDPYPGESEIYLYDASKVICWDDGGEPVCNASIFERNFVKGGFVPGPHSESDIPSEWLPGSSSDYPSGDYFTTTYYTHDTSIQIDELTYGPVAPDNPNWMVQVARFTNLTGNDISGLAIGEAIDWDIPSDQGWSNSSGFDATKSLIYQVGTELDTDDECQDNNSRYGGLALVAWSDGTSWYPGAYGMYSLDNTTQVYPFRDLQDDSLWKYMSNGGISIADPPDADLHTVTTYQWNYTLNAQGELLVYTCLVSGTDGEAAFMAACEECIGHVTGEFMSASSCCKIVSDINHNGAGPDVSDLVYLVTFMFSGGPPPPCMPEADINGNGAGPDVSDLVYLVTFMFSGGPAPVPCP